MGSMLRLMVALALQGSGVKPGDAIDYRALSCSELVARLLHGDSEAVWRLKERQFADRDDAVIDGLKRAKSPDHREGLLLAFGKPVTARGISTMLRYADGKNPSALRLIALRALGRFREAAEVKPDKQGAPRSWKKKGE